MEVDLESGKHESVLDVSITPEHDAEIEYFAQEWSRGEGREVTGIHKILKNDQTLYPPKPDEYF